MANNTDLKLTIEAWAEIVVKTWLQKIIRLNINYSHDLYNSFVHHVITNANGNPERIEFAFNYYGKFSDMGVGNGIKLEDSQAFAAAGLNNRHAKPWYSKTFYAQLQILKELLAEKYAMKASQVILTNLESFDIDGNKPTSAHKASGSRKTSVDSSTGKKKISYQEFQQNRKNNGW